MKINFVFFGTDEFSVSVLEQLTLAARIPALIITTPDRPKGRGLVLTPPPAKQWALKNRIPLLQPEKLDSSFNLQLTTYNLQLFIVASYGLIIPQHVLDTPKRGTLNVHPSLLPKYRGATPIESQILGNEKEVGVTIMLMDAQMDHGGIVAQTKLYVDTVPNANELQRRLAEEGGKLLAEVMPKWAQGALTAKEQDHSKATYTKKLTKSDGELDLAADPYHNFLKIQAFEASIGTYFFILRLGKKIRISIKSAEFADGKLTILRVVPEGKKEMGYEEFLRGMR